MKNGQKIKLADAHVTPRNIKEVHRGTSFIGKNQVTFQHTIFLLLHALCVFLGVSVVFAFSFSFCIACCNKWFDHIMFVLERDLLRFSFAKNTSVFHSYRSTSVLFFLLLHLAFVFHLDFCSDLVTSLHQGVFIPLVYVGFPQKIYFEKV
jgi:hypothetical protein